MLKLKDFYKLICDEFNDGKNLEYKWTRADGYWKMTKGFPNNGRECSLHLFAQALKYDKQSKEVKRKKEKIKEVKIRTKYKGD